MMDLEAIKRMNEEAERRAKEQKLEPYIASTDGDEGVFSCPKLGYWIPEGWELVDKLFVDNSGFGSIDEPALTTYQFLSKVKAGYGYAIYEEGQFQLYIGVYKRV